VAESDAKPVDVVIIGAGHNGLVAAAYLAKAGRKVLVVEERDQVGGAAVTQELFPGYHFSTCADGPGYLAPEIVRQLGLESHGLEIIPSQAVVFSPQPDGSSLTIWRDADRTVEQIARFSAADADAYPRFVALVDKLAGVVGGLMRTTPPALPSVSWSDLRSVGTLAAPARKLGRKNLNQLLRILPMPVADLLDEWFESDVVKGAIAAIAVRDITWGPKEAGTAYTLLCSWALSDTHLFRPAGVVRGGMGALTCALAASATAAGADIRTSSPVASIRVEDGRAAGVRLADGSEISADSVMSSADPRTTFLELLTPRLQSASFIKHVRNIKYRGSGARIHLALRGLPEFPALAGQDATAHLSGAIQIAPSLSYLQRAYDHVKYGEYSEHPYLDVLIPSLSDSGLAPTGHHVMSITAKYAPYALRAGWDEAQRGRFVEIALEALARFAPGLRDLILHQRAYLTPDLETDFGLPEGNPHHGEMTLDQFFHMRPIPGYARYAAPLPGLYLCGAGTHPGGCVTGIPGHNAARELLRKKR
jgi:phytoene dehydrogenase-like protein